VSFVLDTHVLLQWQDASGSLNRSHKRIIGRLRGTEPLLVSDISLWEIATLYELGRIVLDVPLRQWLTSATAPPLVRCVDISPDIAAEVASLPSTFHRDPADRIIVATARVLGATLLTLDERIVGSGLVETA
jgi:PIN domain nuclease of toxin-antitoxin system